MGILSPEAVAILLKRQPEMAEVERLICLLPQNLVMRAIELVRSLDSDPVWAEEYAEQARKSGRWTTEMRAIADLLIDEIQALIEEVGHVTNKSPTSREINSHVFTNTVKALAIAGIFAEPDLAVGGIND